MLFIDTPCAADFGGFQRVLYAKPFHSRCEPTADSIVGDSVFSADFGNLQITHGQPPSMEVRTSAQIAARIHGAGVRDVLTTVTVRLFTKTGQVAALKKLQLQDLSGKYTRYTILKRSTQKHGVFAGFAYTKFSGFIGVSL